MTTAEQICTLLGSFFSVVKKEEGIKTEKTFVAPFDNRFNLRKSVTAHLFNSCSIFVCCCSSSPKFGAERYPLMCNEEEEEEEEEDETNKEGMFSS